MESICDRVVILNKGRVITNETLGNLHEDKTESVLIKLELTNAIRINDLMAIDGVNNVKKTGTKTYTIESVMNEGVREAIFDLVVSANSKILLMEFKQDSLESIFKSVTQEGF